MNRLTIPPRDANSGLEIWDSKKSCPCWLSLQRHRTECLDASPFYSFAGGRGGHQKALQCPYSPCAPKCLLHMRSLPICWRIDLCATKPVRSPPPSLPMSSGASIHPSWAAVCQDHGSAVLGMQEGGEMFWDRLVPTAYHGYCQEISSSSLFEHMGSFWGVSGGHPWTLGFRELQFPSSCGLQ